MIRRALSAAVVVAALACLAAPAWAQPSGFTITSMDVRIRVLDDGTISVVEDITADFGVIAQHGILRWIPVRYDLGRFEDRVLRFHLVGVEGSEGTPVQTQLTEVGDHVRLRIGSPDVLVTGSHVYRIRYTIEGALNSFDDHEELYWNATGDEWQTTILAASARVNGPRVTQVACFRGPRDSEQPCELAETSEAGPAHFATGALAPGEGLTIVAGFAPGSVTVPEPITERALNIDRRLLVALVTAMVAFAPVVVMRVRDRRDRSVTPGPVEFTPPDDLRPAQIGFVVDGSIDEDDVSATLVDLAVRGHLTISEASHAVDGQPSNWELSRVGRSPSDSLTRWEKALLEGVFLHDDRVLVTDLEDQAGATYSVFKSKLVEHARRGGWFVAAAGGGGAGLLGFFGFIFSLTMGLPTIMSSAPRYWFVPVILAAASIGFIYAAIRAGVRRTPGGRELYRRVLGFREYIATAERERMAFAEDEHIFARYLPYAMVFGLVDKWTRVFEGVSANVLASGPAGTWYEGSATAGAVSFGAAMTTLGTTTGAGITAADLEATRVTTSTSSSSSGSSFSSGSSGFSSGSSGGGGGGGGGGSW